MVSGGVLDGAERSDAPCKLVIGSQLDLDRDHSGFRKKLDHVAEALLPLRAIRAATLAEDAQQAELEGKSGSWWWSRAVGLGVPLGERWQHGQDNRLQLVQKETGELGLAVCTCRQRVCGECERARAARLQRRIAAVAGTHDEWQRSQGREPAMITLTLRDSGSPAQAVALMRRAWPMFRLALAALGGSMGSGGSWVRAEEYTDGARGHCHWHVVVWLPPFIDYEVLHRAWWRALVVAAEQVGMPDLTTGYASREKPLGGRWPVWVPHWRAGSDCGCDDGSKRQRDRCGDEPCGRHTPGSVNVQRRRADESSVEAAAGYCLKAAQACGAMSYALKGSGDVQVEGEQAVQAFAEYLDSLYGKRRFQGSICFWKGGRYAPGVPVLPDVHSDWAPLAALDGKWPDRIQGQLRWWLADSSLVVG